MDEFIILANVCILFGLFLICIGGTIHLISMAAEVLF